MKNNKYIYLFLFDHSCGHDQMDEKSLNVLNTNKDYGGKVPIFNLSKILHTDTFLGNHSYPYHDCLQLKLGNTQSFSFTKDDKGPFNLTSKDREETRHDKLLGYPEQ